MALTPGYEYDIFISYAHVDNLTFPGQADGWIQQFYKNLNLMLAKRYGRLDVVKIWWDSKKLDGSVLFDDSIASGIKNSAIMICLNSPGYRASEYCNKELKLFHKKASSEKVGLKVADRSRIIHVLLNNIPFQEWPEELSGTSGFPFHDATEQNDYGDPYETTSEGFRNQMRDLRDAVWHLLNDFPSQQPDHQLSSGTGKSDVDIEENKKNFSIFFSEVPDTLRSAKKRIYLELEKKGFEVLTGVPPPHNLELHDDEVKSLIGKADLSINLMDQYPGSEIIDQSNLYYPQHQTQIALESDIRQMIWIPAHVDFNEIEEEFHKSFLEQIEAGTISDKSYEFIRGNKSALVNQIMDYADQIMKENTKQEVVNKSTSVLLDTHFKDQLYAMDLGKTLIQNEIQAFINPQEDDPRKNIELLGERIKQVRKLVFLYGNVSKEWVMERVSAALQLIVANNYPIDDFFIYMAPPHKEDEEISINQRFLKINIVDSSDQKIPEASVLKDFINQLKANSN
ncbi:MAG: toll/interleukin-1 receptor domain-containing protein [Cyclobacteriaceae bacterium]